jgi:hypothetical protein
MAQVGANGLFGEVLLRCNAGSLRFSGGNAAQLCCGQRVWSPMTHSSLHPMDAFKPNEPAILHDRLTDTIITWTADQAEDYRRNSRTGDDGTVAWKAYLFDGWGNVLGG